MIGSFVQQQIDPLDSEMAEVERLIGIQDELIIAGLYTGMDTFEAEHKSQAMRVILEGMKVLGHQQEGRKQ